MNNQYSKEQIEAFWSKVAIRSPKKCWEWQGARKPKGYGNVRVNKKYLCAHRVAWEMAFFPVPGGFQVCHVCDNPSCCNPNHLMLGTIRANAIDMVTKCRGYDGSSSLHGEHNNNAKLTEELVRKIRGEHASGKSQSELGKKYHVAQTTIGMVVNKKTWRHVK